MTGPAIERRFAPCELRAGEGPGVLSGVVVRYGDRARLARDLEERIEAAAFGPVGTLAAVPCNSQHNDRRTVGLAVLTNAAAELRAEVPLVDCTDGRDVAALVRAGALRGFSVEMLVHRDRFEAGLRIVQRAELVGLGVVASPAYGDSVAALRARLAAALPPGNAPPDRPRRRQWWR